MSTEIARNRRKVANAYDSERRKTPTAKPRGDAKVVCSVSSTKESKAASSKRHTKYSSDLDRPVSINSKTIDEVIVTCLIEHVDHQDFSVDLRFPCMDGSQRTVRVSRGELDHVSNLRRILAKKGATPQITEKGPLERLKNASPNQLKQITARLGWYGDDIFVLPCRTFGSDTLTYDLPSPEMEANHRGRCRGSLEAWQEGLREPLAASSYLIFGLALGFAAPLGALAGLDETAVFHLFGESNAGKTLMAKVAESIIGRATERDLQHLNQTTAGFNDVMARYNGTLLPVNELKTGNAANGTATYLSDFAHILTLGVGRNRADSAKSERGMQTHRWRLFGLTNMEISLEQLSKAPREDGERARHIDLPVPAVAKGGIFDRCPVNQKPVSTAARELAREAEKTIAEHYGVAFPPFIEHVINERDQILRIFKAKAENFVEMCVVDKDDNWDRRLAIKFGYVYAGGSIAIRAGLLPCSRSQLRKACAALYRKAQANLSYETVAKEGVLTRLLRAMDDTSSFPRIEAGCKPPKNFDIECSGFLRRDPGRGDYLFTKPKVLQAWAGSTGNFQWLMNQLKSRKAHVPDGEGKLTQPRSITGKRRERYICLELAALRNMITA